MQTTSIIILNYNDSETTQDFLEQIKDYQILKHIIIVDNASSDDSFKKLLPWNQYAHIDVIKSDKNGGYAYGNNFGIHYLNNTYGDSDTIIISNPDIEIKETVIQQCVDFLEQTEDAALVAPRMLDKHHNLHPFCAWKRRTIRGDFLETCDLTLVYRNFKRDQMYPESYFKEAVVSVDCLPGSFFVAKNSYFKEIGYFDTGTFLYYEEDIIASKLQKKGYQSYLLTVPTFVHYESVSINKILDSRFKETIIHQSRKYYFKTCIPNYHAYKYLPFYLNFKLQPYYRRKKWTYRVPKWKEKITSFFSFLKRIPFQWLVKLWKICLLILLSLLKPILMLQHRLQKTKQQQVNYWISPGNLLGQNRSFHLINEWAKNKDVTINVYCPHNVIKHVQAFSTNKNIQLKSYPYSTANSLFFQAIHQIITITKYTIQKKDVIIFTHPKQAEFYFIKGLNILKTPIYYEHSDKNEFYQASSTTQEIMKKLLPSIKSIIFEHREAQNKFIETYQMSKHQCFIVPNGYDSHHYPLTAPLPEQPFHQFPQDSSWSIQAQKYYEILQK